MGMVLLAILPLTAAASGPAKALFTGEMENFVPAASSKPVPEITFTDAAGRAMTLADFRGKVILLNLWATWCPPCRREMPALDALQAELGGNDFEVVILSIDRGGPAKVMPFLKEIGIRNLTPYFDPRGKSTRALRTYGLPTTLLIDSRGRELGRMIGPAEWNSPDARTLIRHYLDGAEK